MKIAAKFRKIAADGKITKTEAKRLAAQIKKGGVSKAEVKATQSGLSMYADSFDAGATKPLQALKATKKKPAAGGSQQAAQTGGSSSSGGSSGSSDSILGKLDLNKPQMPKDLNDDKAQLEYQEKMQAYNRRISFATNMLQMSHDSNKAIIGNFRS